MLPENFIYVVLVSQVFAASTYMWATLKGHVQPNRVSWLLWGVLTLISFFASLDAGAGKEALLTLTISINRFIIFGLTFVNKKAYWKIIPRDYWLGAIAAVGLVLWMITGEGLLALGLAIFANFMAGLPTMIKAYQQPESESGTLFKLCLVNSMLALMTVQEGYTLGVLGFPLYLIVFCSMMVYFISIRPFIKQHAGQVGLGRPPSTGS